MTDEPLRELPEPVRSALRAIPKEPVPDELRRRVLEALDREDRIGQPVPERLRGPLGLLLAWRGAVLPKAALAVAVVAVLVGVPLLRSPREAPLLVRETASELADYKRGASPLGVRSRDPETLNAFFANAGLPFSPAVSPLQAVGCELVGACLRTAGGQPRAVVAYRDEAGHALLCSTFEGDVTRLARGATTLERNGRTLYVHEVDGVTLVCWQEGSAINLVASDMPRAALVLVAEKESRG